MLGAEGSLIDNKYEILRRLATGGMGDVYLVRHRHLQEERVVKVIRQDLASDPTAAERFQQEARVATQIKNPHVANLYDYSMLPDGRFYMVWEYIEGHDLGTRIREHGPVPPLAAVEIAIQTLRGLAAIHGAGVIHRDVSPDNIMLATDIDGRDQVKIIDLGLVKDLSSAGMELTQAGTFMGKFRYCSPEQAGYLKEGTIDARSDLYSLAQVLYEMLTGLPPFDSESQHGFVLKRLTENPLPLMDRNPQVALPAPLGPVVMKGLERERERRFADATSFIAALREMADELTGSMIAPDPLPPEVTARTTALPAPPPAVESKDLATAELLPPSAAPEPPSSAPPPVPAKSSLPPPEHSSLPSPASATPLPPASATPPLATAARKVDRGLGKELTKSEKLELLAKIEGSGTKAKEPSRLFARAEQALKEGRFEEARDLLGQMAKKEHDQDGVALLQTRLDEAEGIARRRQQVLQAEQMLEKYLLERQQTLATLALETLLELYPNHPKRDDYASWVGMLADEAEQQKRAEEAFAAGRKAVAQGDLKSARRLMSEVENLDLSGELAGTLLSEVRSAEEEERHHLEIDSHTLRVEELLAAGKADEAAAEVEALADLEVSRASLDVLRGRVAEVLDQSEQVQATEPFEGRYTAAISDGDWIAAREVAREMERAVPESPRSREMYVQITRHQSADQRDRALTEGLRTFDRLLAAGDLDQAELALTVLRQMNPGDPKVEAAVARFEAIGDA